MSDYHNPLSVVIPHEFHNHQDFPTEVVAHRFQAYRDIVKDLISYLRQYASVQEEIVRQQVRLQQAVGAASQSVSHAASSEKQHSHIRSRLREKPTVNDDDLSAINQFFLPIGNGLIQDIPTILTKFHQQNIQTSTKTLKDINQVIIPKLEDLRKDLLVKVKEIKNLQNDFKNTLSREITETKALIAGFNQAIDVTTHFEKLGSAASLHYDLNGDADNAKKDPFLMKIKLERQLKRQLHEEAYLYEAYKNLQMSSEKLESIVVLEIQNHMGMFLNLVENESSSVSNFLVPNFTQGFLAKEPNLEWEAFILRNLPRSSSISHNLTSGMFIDLSFPSRKISDLAIPHYDSLLNIPVREGSLERRSKFLKSYSGGWYVLTCSYLHEFKSPDRKKDQNPVMSLSLDHCLVSEHSKNDGKLSGAYKFVLYSKLQNGLIHRGHNWSFRCETYQTMIEWYNDIKTLTSLPSPTSRAKAMSKKLTANDAAGDKLSRTSSAISGHTGVKSLRSSASRARNRLTQEVTNSSVVSTVPSHRSATASGLNRASLSPSVHRSPKLSNLLNSDGTAVASSEEHTKDNDSVDQNGNITVRTLVSLDRNESRQDMSRQEKRLNGIDRPGSNLLTPSGDQRSAEGHASPQQTIPQNYQYYINQVNQRPQQFYDPVLQQFFMINAIPALQVTQMDQAPQQSLPATTSVTPSTTGLQPQGIVQPMPQYFPSSPLPVHSQLASEASSLHPQQSPLSLQGQSVPGIVEQGKRTSQYIPQFPGHFNEGPSRNAPYPVQFGDSIDGNAQGPSSSGQPEPGRNNSIDERESKVTISDEN
ncbi:hypothetical protein METBIDRAFT_30550 [Metschnikowia bicuspidata var. bicuspidata NRRL YB-4993]|uniref:PH domain-containing protein n=1 Tax=Metschnikowia bicuspidata var. bicuspidata NRRL YB-4993 TaxID=869754 RepID=A0A1A0HJN1_9ASCO|nr:hypothetical protein METBIDRAFT_30550 [Metschnikowia bicuspidata var. bicuspidata NRRL YB-4993]OBA24225.1 hypothetical protein METBIDRAFT_30550 [Metschnikowia bicuspidata var. bicuspidata NRRL YB-4993]